MRDAVRHVPNGARVTAIRVGSSLEARIADEFPTARTMTYLNTAAEGLLPRSGREALLRYADEKAVGERGRAAMYATERRLRERVGRWLDARPDQVAFLPSAARGVDAVIQSIDWRAGDSIVTGDAEFPSNLTGPLRLRERGVDVRIVASPDGRYASDELERLLDARTRLVIVSLVSFRTGFRVDVERIAGVAHAQGALLLVDATQAFGAFPVTLAPADYLVASTFKWALAAHGATVFAVGDTVRDREPASVGWRGIADLFEPIHAARYTLHPDARRFEEGMPSYGALFTLEATLDLLESLGQDVVEATIRARVRQARDGLAALRIPTLASPDERERAGIVAFETERFAEITAALAARDISVWGRDGRVRISPHAYTSATGIEAFLEALEDVRRR